MQCENRKTKTSLPQSLPVALALGVAQAARPPRPAVTVAESAAAAVVRQPLVEAGAAEGVQAGVGVVVGVVGVVVDDVEVVLRRGG